MDILSSLTQQLESNQFLSGGALLMVSGAILAQLRGIPGWLWNRFIELFWMELEIPSDDPAYRWITAWLAEHHYSREWARRLSVKSKRDTVKGEVFFFPSPGSHFMFWRGRPLYLHRERKDQIPGTEQREYFHVSLFTRNRQMLKDLIDEAYHVSRGDKDDTIEVFVPDYGWESRGRRRKRHLDTVIMAGDVADSLLGDVRQFRESEQWYRDRGIPYRRGYLLYGPPGNGKSSLILAIASELSLDVYCMSLAGIKSDDSFQSLIGDVPSNGILLLEDVDALFEDAENKDGFSFSGLLNAIDGITAPEGRVMFMTTNHKEKLRPALIRPGRCDRTIEIGHATQDQVRRLVGKFFPGEINVGAGLPMALLQEICVTSSSLDDVIKRIIHESEKASHDEGVGVQADTVDAEVGKPDDVSGDD